jgi:two-component system KDP operon response regulator KdpE
MNESGILILIVEDEPQMLRFLRTALGGQGFRTIEAETAKSALIAITTQNPEIILLDLGLPDADGIDLTKQIREWSRIPIIVISARGRESDKISALDAGADDYLTKPFGFKELLARIRVALRHSMQSPTQTDTPVIQIGPMTLDIERREVHINESLIHLTPIEYRLLVYLAKNSGRVLTHRQILKEVWGAAYTNQTQYLRVFITQLRRKLEPDPTHPRLMITEPGVGYRMMES